jgi:Holliday junction resolvase RusA-like endonuclease
VTLVIFKVYGVPKGKGRARYNGDTQSHYTPSGTRSYENQIGYASKAAMKGREVHKGPVSLVVVVVKPVAASWSKKKTALALSGDLRPTSTPDLDNIVKAFCDGMNGVVFKDDSQVVELTARQMYGECPYVECHVLVA